MVKLGRARIHQEGLSVPPVITEGREKGVSVDDHAQHDLKMGKQHSSHRHQVRNGQQKLWQTDALVSHTGTQTHIHQRR
ncbi:hypothetical protein B0T17DRAFT_527130 [Bombardia bombarda]|uniref:Uncharacterized protein n=1 Tax=Bombardia bombarda TaxID=252184 RepID=A0AA39XAP5_9PEZI|nr:hypothetical protein B0T17DRAFT_527130 [Bombardia bombarda]